MRTASAWRLFWCSAAALVACASDGVIAPEREAPGPVASLLQRLPFLAAEVADARARPARARDGGPGFVVAGRSARALLGGRASDAIEVRDRGAQVALRRAGAGRDEGKLDGGVVLYPGAFPGADALVVAQGEGVEELIIAHGPGAEVEYEAELPGRWSLRGQGSAGLVEVIDEQGEARMRVWARRAWDAAGQPVALSVQVDGARLRLRVEGAERWPVVIDPLFVGTGSMLAARLGHSETLLLDGTVLLAGGVAGGEVSAELYDPRTGRFSMASPMQMPRAGHGAALLPDGRVLLAGGGFFDKSAETAELYDPATRSFSLVEAPLVRPRATPLLAPLPGGNVLVVGGEIPSTTAAEVYDIATGLFSPTKGPMVLDRDQFTATPLLDGRVLLFGDRFSPALQAEVYDPVSSTFSVIKKSPSSTRVQHTATLLPDGRVLLAGGSADQSPSSALQKVEIFDPAKGTVEAAGFSLSTARRNHASVLLDDGRVLLVGGQGKSKEPLDSAELLDLEQNDSRTSRGRLAVARALPTVTRLASGALIAGGMLADETPLANAELLATGDLLALLATPSVGRSESASASLADGRALLFGSSESRVVEAFDPATGQWSCLGGLMLERRLSPRVARLVDDRVLVTGGYLPGQIAPIGSGELYNPASDSFEPASNAMAFARHSHSSTTLASGQVLIAGGVVDGAAYSDRAEIFSPGPSSFVLLESAMVEGRSGHTATLLLDGKVLLAGGLGPSFLTKSAELFDPISQSFSPTAGSMAIERSRHTATLLLDGRVVIVGGVKEKKIELFDPAQGLFLGAKGALKRSREGHTATLLDDGRVLIAGGGEGSDDRTAELFDPTTGTSELAAGEMTAHRSFHQAEKLPDGRVLLQGGLLEGQSLSSAELFDPQTGTFSRLQPDFSTEGRALTEAHDGSLTLSGGADGEPLMRLAGDTSSPLGVVDPRRFHTATALPDRSILLVGGRDAAGAPLASVVRYSLERGLEGSGSLLKARERHTATRLPDGRVLVAGGEASGLPLDSFEVVAPSGGSTAGKLLLPRSRHAAALLPDGRVVLVGGGNLEGDVGIAEVIDPIRMSTSGLGEALVGADASVGFVGESAMIFSGSRKTVRFEPSSQAFFDIDVPPGSAVATMPGGLALVCRDLCGALGPRSDALNPGAVLLSRPGDSLKIAGTASFGVVGARPAGPWRGWGSLLDGGPRPSLDPPAKIVWSQGERGVVSGAGWPASDEPQPAPGFGDEAVLAWKPLDGAGPVHPLRVLSWGANTIQFELPRTAYHGLGWLYALVRGRPSEPHLLLLLPAAQGEPCSHDSGCASGFCVDGLCCDQRCQDGCLACTASRKGGGADGACGPVVAGGEPRSGCENPEQKACGFSGRCDGTGSCELPGIDVVCGPKGERCQGGECAPPPVDVCSALGDQVVSISGNRPCGDYRCRDGACLARCAAQDDCAAGRRCDSAGQCVVSEREVDLPDPGLLCSSSPGPARGGAWLLCFALAAAWRRRRSVAAASVLALGASLARAQDPPAGSAPAAGSGAPAASSSAPAADLRREEARDLLRKGLAIYQAGDPLRALDFFLRSRAVFPAKGNTLNAANCLRLLGRLDESLELYEEAVASYSASFDEDDQSAVPAAMADLRSRLGGLFVSSSVSGSLVIDGKERGKLPLGGAVRLIPGDHQVRIIKDGYRTFEARIVVVVGETVRLDAQLEALAFYGGLRIEDPELRDAEVLVDGVVVGRSPWEGTLAPGPHIVVSRRGAQGSAPTLATVLQGQTALLRLRSSRLGAGRRVAVQPASAELRLGDVPLGQGQWIGSLPAGRYTIQAAEEGYLPASAELVVTDEPAPDLVLSLVVDPAHPRWPRTPPGVLLTELRSGYGVGAGLSGGAEASCASASCPERGLLSGPSLGLGLSYEFPSRWSLDALGGVASFSQQLRRSLPRSGPVGVNEGISYQLDDRLRLKGYLLGVGAGRRIPLAGRWSLRARALVGVLFGQSSDAISGRVSGPSGSASVQVVRSGQEATATSLLLLPDLSLVAELPRWRFSAGLGAWVTLSRGPSLPSGDLQSHAGCPAPSAPGCVADSAQIAGERAHGRFWLLVPTVSLARSF